MRRNYDMKYMLTRNQIEKLNESKLHLCQALRFAMARSGEDQTYLAFRLGTCRSCGAQVQAGQVDKLTFNQLFRYLARMDTRYQLLVAI